MWLPCWAVVFRAFSSSQQVLLDSTGVENERIIRAVIETWGSPMYKAVVHHGMG
jgi:hypothetical protein